VKIELTRGSLEVFDTGAGKIAIFPRFGCVYVERGPSKECLTHPAGHGDVCKHNIVEPLSDYTAFCRVCGDTLAT
jgi:hypothetical protein